jgi:hypothetical protein
MQTFHEPPSLRPHCSSLSTVSHPELGLKSTQLKGFLTRLKDHRQQERLRLRCQLKLTTYSPSFPTCLSHPGSVPLLYSIVLRMPHFLSRLQQQAGQEVSENCSCSLSPSRNQSPTILSPRELLTGLTTRLFSPYPKLTSYTNTKNGYGYGSGTVIKIQRITQWVCACSWMIDWMTPGWKE